MKSYLCQLQHQTRQTLTVEPLSNGSELVYQHVKNEIDIVTDALNKPNIAQSERDISHDIHYLANYYQV